jgi:hypothetical protein
MSKLKCDGAVQEAYDQRFSTFPNFRMTFGRALINESYRQLSRTMRM